MHTGLKDAIEVAPQHIPYATYVWVLVLSIWGGIASYIQKMKSGVSRFNLMEIFGEIVIAGFAGVMTYYVCAFAHTPEVLSAVAVGISGHMGTRAISVLEIWIGKKLGLPHKDNPNPKSKD